MSIIKPKPEQEREKIRVQIDSQILAEIGRYCEYAGFKKPDEFFEEAAIHILTRDKEFKEWKETSIQSVSAE